MGKGSPLPFPVAGLSARPRLGKVVTATARELYCKNFLRPQTAIDLVKNESMGEPPHGECHSGISHCAKQHSTLKLVRSGWNFSLRGKPNGLPAQTVCNSLDALLM